MLHLISCHGRMMPQLTELLFFKKCGVKNLMITKNYDSRLSAPSHKFNGMAIKREKIDTHSIVID